MTTSLIDADSLLVIDVGSITTRAMLFDVVEGRYRFLAVGTASTTAGAPYHDVSEGVHRAIEKLQTITGRVLIGPDENLITPSLDDGSGVDTFAATISAGPPLKMVAVGLLEDVSLESAKRLASTTYVGKLDSISLNDRRKPEARIDTIIRSRPDVIVIAGGTEGGASQSVLKLLESVGLACYLLPEAQRPEILFAGNQNLQDEIQDNIKDLAELHFAPNVRPTLEVEQLDAAQTQIGDMYCRVRSRQISGVKELREWSSGGLMPTSSAFGRLIRFLSKAYASTKGVLGVDLGASATTVAAGFAGDLILGVYPQFGLGRSLVDVLQYIPLSDITRWLTQNVPESYVLEYIANKSIYPASLPVTQEDLVVEQALARQLLNSAVKQTFQGTPHPMASSGPGLLPWLEPIVASGSVLSHAPSLAHSLLMLLDGLQPTGVTTIVLDQNHLSSALGVAAAINPVLSVQVLDSNTFLYLGTVISPVGNARAGTPVLTVKMTYDNGHETRVDVKQGSLEVLPLSIGQTARVHLQPLHRYDVGMGAPGRSGKLNVHGGALGLVIDARGRPLTLPGDAERRYELFKKWLWTLGG